MRVLTGLGLCIVWLLAACGGTKQVVTQTVYQDPNREVGLQPVAEKAFSHPASLKKDLIAKVMAGLYIERPSSSLPLLGGGSADRLPAFNKNEIAFFAPLLARGLNLAQPNEVVTFYEHGEISDVHEVTTSGGMFVHQNVLYVILSNHGAQTEIWQDVEEYHSPVRLQPLKQLDPQPGRLVFDPAEFMVPLPKASFATTLQGKPWQVGIRWQALK